MFKQMCSSVEINCSGRNLGLLLLRIALGVTFIMFGWMKISDIGMTTGFFASLGIPAYWVYIVGYGELLSGLAVLLGILIVPAALFISVTMVVAIATVTGSGGFTMYYPNMVLIFNAVALIFLGVGRFVIFRCPMSQGCCMCGEKADSIAPVVDVK